MLDALAPCWVVVPDRCVVAVTICPATVGVIGCCGEPSVMGVPTMFQGVDVHGSSTVTVLEDTPMPGQVVTGMRHWASLRLALVSSVVAGGCPRVNRIHGGAEPVELAIGGHAADAWEEELNCGGRDGGFIFDNGADLKQNSTASRIAMSYRKCLT